MMSSEVKKPSYLGAMLSSQENLYAILGVGAVAAVAAIPFGLVGLALPLLALGVGETLAALIVPDLVTFRAKVDEKFRRDQRAQYREHILREISSRIPIGMSNFRLETTRARSLSQADLRRATGYNNMIERIRSLSSVASDRRTQLGSREIERLHEAAIDYLSLWLARLVIDTREQNVSTDDINREIKQLDLRLRNASPAEARQLQQARRDYVEMLSRRDSMAGKGMAIDAAMLAMPDRIEEIYQMILGARFSSGIGDKIEDSLSRLRLEEALEQELSADLSGQIPHSVMGMAFQHAEATPAPVASAPPKPQTAQTRIKAAASRTTTKN
jgi:hypothetical protein